MTAGDNLFTVIRKNADGVEIARLSHTLHYAGAPVRGELVKEACRLIADGKQAPVIAIRLTDKDGFPARPGVLGEYEVLPPYEPYVAVQTVRDGLPHVDGKPRYAVDRDGIARIRLQPSTRSGEVVIRFYLDGQEQVIREWLQSDAREWVLVGLAEGTAGYHALSGNMENLETQDVAEDFYRDGRLAFFAKGKIKGSWLLTAAYDSARDRHDPNNRLFQVIDPNTYYTLYGDATQQQYEAASVRKLYLKIERERFYALFGDYDTGLNITELSRYSRRFNGLKSEYQGEHFGYSAFAADTNKAYVRDEIQGDGTSGVYRLSRRSIVINSEKITIQTRDRFRSDLILSSQTLLRFVDYSIDYEAGTLFFKAPVYSRDEFFNPIFIVVEYESEDAVDETYTYGGRGAVKFLNGRVEMGATALHEGPKNAEADLGGLDARVELGAGLKLKAEMAATRKQESGERIAGQAWLAEVNKTATDFDGRLYIRQTGEDFGLGQQNGSDRETRKYGGDAAWRFKEHWSALGEAYHYDNLAAAAQRDFVQSNLTYRDERYSLTAGARWVEDRFDDGTVNPSTQLLAGAARTFFENRLKLHLTREQSLFGNDESVDFPTRTLIGADYKVAPPVALFAEHEITQGATQDSQSSRVGLKAVPWSGGQIGSSVGRQMHENGMRLFANLGLFQTWQINSRWSIDGGLDRSQSIRQENYAPFNTNVPTAAGAAEDFTAASAGLGYKAEAWSWTGRIEQRWADTQDKWNLLSGIAGEVRQGLGMSAGLQLFSTDSESGGDTLSGDLRLSAAFRPDHAQWIVFDRLDFIFDDRQDTETSSECRRIVNNFNANFKALQRLQLALQYGAKYVLDTIENRSYTGYTDLTGIEARFDLSAGWDVGLQASLLHSWQVSQLDYRTGFSVGYTLFKNAWLSLGYNFSGFKDEDFSAADFTAKGPFIKFRLKFDQQSVREMVDWFSCPSAEPI